MDDAVSNRKLLEHGSKSTVLRADPTTAAIPQQRSGDKKKCKEPPCPINVKGTKLGHMIDNWLTFMRQEVDEQQKLTKTVESTDSHPGQSENDMDGVLVCVYDRRCSVCYNQNRPRTNVCNQTVSSCYDVGNNISLTGSNCGGPNNNYRRPLRNFSDPNACSNINAGCQQRNTSIRRPNVCLGSPLQISNNLFEAPNTKTTLHLSKCQFQQPNTHCKQSNTGFKQANTCSIPPNTAFDQLQISHAQYISEKPDTCC